MSTGKMVVRDQLTWVGYQELLDYTEQNDQLKEVINKGLYRQRRQASEMWINTKIDGLVHILYSSIPSDTLQKYSLPTESKLAATTLTRMVKPDASALDHYRKSQGAGDHAQELATIAGWLTLMASFKRQEVRRMGFESTDQLYTCAIQSMAETCAPELWKCSSLQVFKRKLKPFNQLFKTQSASRRIKSTVKAYDSLISRKIGNANSRKLGAEQEALLIQIYSEPNKPSIEQTFMMYSRSAAEMVARYDATGGAMGWDNKCLISYSTARNFITSPRVQQIVYEKRHGHAQYSDKYEIVTKRLAPTAGNGMWVIDGSPIHRYYNYKGKAYARLNVFAVIDAASWCILGFYISEKETSHAVASSLRSACEMTGYLPYQVLSDNSSAIKSHRMRDLLKVITPHHTPAAPGKARSKIIEPFFKLFNDQVLKFRKGFTASPVGANTLNNQPNREALSKIVKQFPTERQAIIDFYEDVCLWNASSFKGSSRSRLQTYQDRVQSTLSLQREYTHEHRIEAFFTMPGSYLDRKDVDTGKMCRFFSPLPYKYTNKGLGYTVNGQQHSVIIDDVEFNASNIGKRFLIKYDPLSPESAYLYDSNQQPVMIGEDRAHALPREQFHMALMDRQEGEAGRLHEQLERKKAQRAITLDRWNTAVETARENGTYTEAITENAFDKEVLNSAKIQQMEQLITGDDYSLIETPVAPVEKSKKQRSKSSDLRWNLT